jgi:hypothetical protein
MAEPTLVNVMTLSAWLMPSRAPLRICALSV